jgi:FKBP-type peptidyl-prolyl cis-trans isomerase (trigger factor)
MTNKTTKKKGEKEEIDKVSYTVAKSKDGTIQITFNIPFKDIKKTRDIVAKDIGKDLELPGFRKGKAPLNKLLSHIPQNTLVENVLRAILPESLGKAITEHKIKPAIYPKFELISANENENWQVRGITCELPEVKLGNYKKAISDSAKTDAIWTPDSKESNKKKDEEKKVLSREEKERKVIKILGESIKIEIPKPLVDEEVNRRLSDLLQRIEKLGLTLEAYLSSIGKTTDTIRNDYEKQAKEAIRFDLILGKIVVEENIKVPKEEVEQTLKAYSQGNKPETSQPGDQKTLIETVLRKRAALDALCALL